jgi:hypothetical protein
MTLDRVASVLIVLVALLYCQAAAGHPYDPHEPQESPFFEGWFLRITTSNNGPTFAVGIGHLPQQSVRNPSAACFLLLNPPSDNAAAAAQAVANITDLSAKTIPRYLSLQQPRTYTHYFSSLDVHPGKQQAGCIGCPAFVASGENAGGSCRLEVTGDLVILEAEVPGAFKVRLVWPALEQDSSIQQKSMQRHPTPARVWHTRMRMHITVSSAAVLRGCCAQSFATGI